MKLNYEEWYQKKLGLERNIKDLGQPVLPDEYYTHVSNDFDFFSRVFKDVGFFGYMTAIENKYWPKAYINSQEPWYEMHSAFGIVTVGFRKRVIHIGWDPKSAYDEKINAYKNNIKIDTADDVTHVPGDAFIHAWGKEKFVEYLRLLYASMKSYYAST